MAHLVALRSRFILAALAIVAAACSTAAQAQDYRVAPARVNLAQAKTLSGQVATIIRDAQAPNAASQKVLQDFFIGYLFPSLTVYEDPVALGELAEKREQIFQTFCSRTP
jgi:hypothetical protein